MRIRQLIPYLCALMAAPLMACGGDGSVTGTDPGDLPCEAPVDLAVGGTEVLDPSASGSCWLFLPSGAGDRYRVGVLWASEGSTSPTTRSGTVDLTVTRREEATAAPPSSTAAPAPGTDRPTGEAGQDGGAGLVIPASVLGPALESMEATERAHARLRAFDAQLASRLGSGALAPDLGDRGVDVALAPARAAAPEKMSFEPPYESCQLDPTAETIRGELVLETPHLIAYQDSAQIADQPEKAVTASQVQRMADYYAAWGDPVIQDYFDDLSDIDGNGKFIVLVTPVPQDVGSEAAAFVLSRDLYRNDLTNCRASNEAEITYFSAAAIQALDDDNFQALGTLVHEVKHISSLYNRIHAGTGLHETWIEEGTAEIAAEVSSRMAWADSGGPAVGERMTRSSFLQSDPAFNSANWGVLVRLARVARTLSEQPNALTGDPDLAGEGHSYYGSSWHFHRFLGDAYWGGIGSESGFFLRQNTSQTAAGTRFLEQDLGVPMGELEEEMAFGTMVNGTAAESSLARTFSSYEFPSAAEVFCQPNPLGVYPWPVTTSGSRPVTCSGGGYDPVEENSVPAAGFVDATYSGSIGEGGLRIQEFVSDGTGQGIEITADVSLDEADGGEFRVLVTRLE